MTGLTAHFLGNQEGSNATLLPEVLKLGIYAPIPDFKWQSSKDNFHNLILNIDKMLTFGILNSTTLIIFLYLEVDTL